MDHNSKCCVLGCHAKPNQGLRFYRFPCHNPQISSIWEQRICQSANIDFDVLNDEVCELHFDYRCKTGNDCALEEGSLPTLNLPSFGTLFSPDNEHFQMSANRIKEPSYSISLDTLPYHCRFCLRRGLLYEIETSTYRSKSFLSLIDLPSIMLRDNTQPNACLFCLKSIMIVHQLSMAVEHSNTILQLLLQHPKQSEVVLNTNYFDIKSELACCNLILANSLSIKLEIEIEDNKVWANEGYKQKGVGTGEPTSPAAYVNTQNMVEKSTYIAVNQDNVSQMHESITSDKQFYKLFATRGDYSTDLSDEGIPNESDTENTDCNDEVMVSNNSDVSCAEDRQFDNEQAPESTSKAVNKPTYKCDLCRFITNYKANLAIHKNLHLAGNDVVHFHCQKCEKYFLLHRHFVRHNTIVHADDFTCKICDKSYASATKLAVHYTENHHFQCNISSRVSRNGHNAHLLAYKQGQRKSSTLTDKNTHWNENDGVYVCPICDWKNPSFHTFNVHLGKHVQCDKNSVFGLEELETLKTDPVQNVDGCYQCTVCPEAFSDKSDFNRHKRLHPTERQYICTECPKSFSRKRHFSQHKRIHTTERQYICTECPKTFSRKSHFSQHKKIHTNERPYKCTKCSKTFSQQSNFSVHKRIHTNERPYKCTECPKFFNQKSTFTVHMRTHTNERPYKCSECSKTFKQKTHFIVHKRTHTSERPYKCTECLKTFSQNSHFIVHKRIHTNEKPYRCTQCSKTFSQKGNCDIHKRIHTNERRYKCTECPKTFIAKGNFNIHKRIHMNIHSNERPYKCTECPKTFILKSTLDKHKLIHTNERPYKCTKCQKTFSRKSHFSDHKKIHTNERPYKCTDCPKAFIQKSVLITHKKIHTNERPYKCSECPKAFTYKGVLNVHRKTHTNERPYKCAECPKTFSQKSNFSVHQRIHTNERPYKCTECPKTFSQKGNCDIHKRTHTNEKPYK